MSALHHFHFRPHILLASSHFSFSRQPLAHVLSLSHFSGIHQQLFCFFMSRFLYIPIKNKQHLSESEDRICVDVQQLPCGEDVEQLTDTLKNEFAPLNLWIDFAVFFFFILFSDLFYFIFSWNTGLKIK